MVDREKMPVSADTLRRLHKLSGHLLAAANEIEELGPNLNDLGRISEKLEQKTSVTIWKLRNCCDAIAAIQREEEEINKEFWRDK